MLSEKPKRQSLKSFWFSRILVAILCVLSICVVGFLLSTILAFRQFGRVNASQVFPQARRIANYFGCGGDWCHNYHLFWTSHSIEEIRTHYREVAVVPLLEGQNPADGLRGLLTIINRDVSEPLHFEAIGYDKETLVTISIDRTEEVINQRYCPRYPMTYGKPDYDCEEVIVMENTATSVEALALIFEDTDFTRFEAGYFILHWAGTMDW